MKFLKSTFLLFSLLFISNGNAQGLSDTLVISINSKLFRSSSVNTIQEALNNKTKKNLKIILEKGEFLIDQTLVTTRDHTTIKFDKGAILQINNNVKGGILIKNNNCNILNADIRGNGKSAIDIYTSYGVLFSGVSNCGLYNSSLSSISGVPIYLSRNGSYGCENVVIKGNTILKPAIRISESGDESGILLGYSGDGYFHKNNIIENNYIDGNQSLQVGIGLIGHADNIIIRGNSVINCLSYGILAYESVFTNHSLSRVSVMGNIIKNIGNPNFRSKKGMGIYLMHAFNSEISNNRILNTLINNDQSETLGSASIALNSSLDCLVSNNYIDGSFMYGYTNAYGFNNKFIKNTLINIRKSGVYLINVNDVEIRNNKFSKIGEANIKGFFESTSLDYIKSQFFIKKYVDIETGNNISITSNKFNFPKQIIYFRGTPAQKNYKGTLNYAGNYLNNISIFGNFIKGKKDNNNYIFENYKNNINIENNKYY